MGLEGHGWGARPGAPAEVVSGFRSPPAEPGERAAQQTPALHPAGAGIAANAGNSHTGHLATAGQCPSACSLKSDTSWPVSWGPGCGPRGHRVLGNAFNGAPSRGQDSTRSPCLERQNTMKKEISRKKQFSHGPEITACESRDETRAAWPRRRPGEALTPKLWSTGRVLEGDPKRGVVRLSKRAAAGTRWA